MNRFPLATAPLLVSALLLCSTGCSDETRRPLDGGWEKGGDVGDTAPRDAAADTMEPRDTSPEDAADTAAPDASADTSADGTPPSDSNVEDVADSSPSDTSQDTSADPDADTGPAGCRSNDDCTGADLCYPPIDGCRCGPAREGCIDDTVCNAPGSYCDSPGPRDCPCQPPGTYCFPPCRDDGDCAAGEHCNDRQICEAKPCSDDAACPTHFQCDDKNKACSRLTCTTDTDCPDGRCVNGGCYGSLGACKPR